MTDKVTKDMVVNDIIKLYPGTIGVFTHFNIDSCCGGAANVEDSAKRDNAPLDELLEALNEAV